MLRITIGFVLVVMAAGTGFLFRRHLHPVSGVAMEFDKPAEEPYNSLSDVALPIRGLRAADIQDTFDQARGGGERKHEATDILAPRGTPVQAVTDGRIKKLFTSKPGGLTIYQYDPNEEYCYYYAHLDGYAEDLKEGMNVKQGDVIGFVGTTGNADPHTPHLHFAILRLGTEKQWWTGTEPVNPYSLLMAALERTRKGK